MQQGKVRYVGCSNSTAWQMMKALGVADARRLPRFVKQYADLHGVLLSAAQEYVADVQSSAFPGPDHTF